MTFVTGGFASLMLANQGAEVIKVERPTVGDDNRHSGPPFVETENVDRVGKIAAEQGESPYFWTINYDKRSVELNLKNDDAREVLYDLIGEADVFLENFRPGTTEKLGVHYDRIQECNPGIVYCSISAFGETGPWSQRPGYYLLIQGKSDIMCVTGTEGGGPVKVEFPQTDLITAMWAAFGIVGALFRREHIGKGGPRRTQDARRHLPLAHEAGGESVRGRRVDANGDESPGASSVPGVPDERWSPQRGVR
jgi:succinate---hydroxymethylglutarate CoA-transferase